MSGAAPLAAPLVAGLIIAAVALFAAGTAIAFALRGRRGTRELEEQLELARDRAARADAARDTFFDLATHELRSPLAAVLGYQELLADGAYGPLDDDATEAVRRIGRSSQHLLHLIEGVVELSRLSAGTVRPDVQSVDLAPLLAGIADALKVHAHDRGIDVDINLPDRPGTLRTDPARLLRALDLIITSAARNPGHEILTLTASHDDDALRVTLDGIAVQLKDDVGDPLLRLGLRLAIASGLARVLGGELLLRESPDRRTISSVSFTARTLEGIEGFDGPRGPR